MWPLWLCAVLGKLAISLCQCAHHTFSACQPQRPMSVPGVHRIRVDQGCARCGLSRVLRSFVRDATVGLEHRQKRDRACAVSLIRVTSPQ